MFKDTQGKAESKMKAELMSKIKSLVTFEDQYKRNIDNDIYKKKYIMTIDEVSISEYDAHYKDKNEITESILQ